MSEQLKKLSFQEIADLVEAELRVERGELARLMANHKFGYGTPGEVWILEGKVAGEEMLILRQKRNGVKYRFKIAVCVSRESRREDSLEQALVEVRRLIFNSL